MEDMMPLVIITGVVILISFLFYIFTPSRIVLIGRIKSLKERKFYFSENSYDLEYVVRMRCYPFFLGGQKNCRIRIPIEFYEDINKIRQEKKYACLIVEKYRYQREYKCIYISEDT